LKTEANASHTTLQMAFQTQLPIEIETGPKKIIELTVETSLFGIRRNTLKEEEANQILRAGLS